MIKYRPESFDDCIAEAVRKFYIYYRNNVRQLLFTYPIDMKTKDGKPFWALPKRPPSISLFIKNKSMNLTTTMKFTEHLYQLMQFFWLKLSHFLSLKISGKKKEKMAL